MGNNFECPLLLNNVKEPEVSFFGKEYRKRFVPFANGTRLARLLLITASNHGKEVTDFKNLSRNPKEESEPGQESVPQGLKPGLFSARYGTAEAVPFQNSSEDRSFWTNSKQSVFGGFEDRDCLDRQPGPDAEMITVHGKKENAG